MLERCKRRFGWDNDFASLVLASYRQFIECKRLSRDWDDTKLLAPSIPPVAQMWHQHVLDTKSYFEDCQILVGHVIHHDPDEEDDALLDPQARALRIQRAEDLIALQNDGGAAEILNNSRAWNFDIDTSGAPGNDDTRDEDVREQPSRCRARVPDEKDSSLVKTRNVRSKPDDSSATRTGDDDDDDKITLRCREIIREKDGAHRMKETYFDHIKKTTKLSEVFASYAQMRQVQSKSLCFMYNGERIKNANQTTPLMLEMNEKMATIKVSLLEHHQQTGSTSCPLARV